MPPSARNEWVTAFLERAIETKRMETDLKH
jgi:hypothetical protein